MVRLVGCWVGLPMRESLRCVDEVVWGLSFQTLSVAVDGPVLFLLMIVATARSFWPRGFHAVVRRRGPRQALNPKLWMTSHVR